MSYELPAPGPPSAGLSWFSRSSAPTAGPAGPPPPPPPIQSFRAGAGREARTPVQVPAITSFCRLLASAGPPEAILVCPVFVSRGCDKDKIPVDASMPRPGRKRGPGPVRRMNSEGDDPFCQARRRPSLQPGVYRGNKVIGQVGPGAPASRASAVRSGQSRASARAA